MVVSSEAKKGGDVLEQVKVTCPDAIILDCDLPGLRAGDLLRAVRAVCPGVWVVAICARSEARQAAMLAGADAFVSKAEPPQSLLSTIRQGTGWRASGGSGNAMER